MDKRAKSLVTDFLVLWEGKEGQREYFDKMKPGEFAVNASEYAECHPYMEKGEVL